MAADEFAESEYEVRKAALESAATTVSEEVFRYWSQNPELTVELTWTSARPARTAGAARRSWTSASATTATG